MEGSVACSREEIVTKDLRDTVSLVLLYLYLVELRKRMLYGLAKAWVS
jgi:hypothetical protein